MQLFHDAAAAHDRITQSTAQAPQLLASGDFNEVEGVLDSLSPVSDYPTPGSITACWSGLQLVGIVEG